VFALTRSVGDQTVDLSGRNPSKELEGVSVEDRNGYKDLQHKRQTVQAELQALEKTIYSQSTEQD
jgi:hypothetical protein